MQNTSSKIYVGIDVSKSTLAINSGVKKSKDIANRAGEIRRTLLSLQRELSEGQKLHVCFEATGPYTKKIKQVCSEQGIAYSTLNPTRVRKYAESMSIAAKTDAIDAAVIRAYAEHKQPCADVVKFAHQEELVELCNLRKNHMDEITRLKGLLESSTSTFARKHTKSMIQLMNRRLQALMMQIKKLCLADPMRKAIFTELIKIEGVGELTAILVLAYAPEIGTLGRRKSASISGLAPYPHTSGTMDARRYISGGRRSLRLSLYMAALSASMHNSVLKYVYAKKINEGKPSKVALTCIMRKLFVYMDRVATSAINRYTAEQISA